MIKRASKGLAKFFQKTKTQQDFSCFRISLASPEMIRSWSYGEVRKAETINYRTFKPERDGLFCAKIFGPIKDYECLCGKYKHLKHRGVICEKCGVEVTRASVRRERMGHIELASSVAHVWFLRSLPSRIGLLLDMSLRDIERVLYFEVFVVIDSGMTELFKGQILTEEEFSKYHQEYPGQFEAKMGAEAIKDLISSTNLEIELEKIKTDIENTVSDTKLKRLSKRLQLIKAFIYSGNKPEWMIIDILPVLPPDLRPLVPLDGGVRFVSSDLNELYRRVINRNARLKKLIDLNAPEIIVRNEKRMLQEVVDALLDNGRRGRVVMGSNKRPLKSLSDMIKGKQGRFRQNLLGKRVDYSGRSVIVVGPELKLHQCGLPKFMALELFKPFVYGKLMQYDIASNIKSARLLVDQKDPQIWDILEEVIHEHPVLLNRAPTLHRLGIQAFESVLIEGKAIQLHPLVCMAFNADFDGDQMAVHLPISYEAQLEARVLMMSTNNILSPAHGEPVIEPSQDIVLGIYYMTHDDGEFRKRPPLIFSDINEVLTAFSIGRVDLHETIKVRLKAEEIDQNATQGAIVETTVGRVILFDSIEKIVPFERINKMLKKKDISRLVDFVYKESGPKNTILLADRLMRIGFKYATLSGVSISVKDLEAPPEKQTIIDAAYKKHDRLEDDFNQGLITQEEKYNKTVDIWTRTTEEVAQYMMKKMGVSTIEDDEGNKKEIQSFNSVYMMADSGARGSSAQIRQLAGMRGLLAKSDGSIIEVPITSNFREGLSVSEYFLSTHGARKGLADTALKTANSGHLTRRLVDVAQDVVITEDDCNTQNGIIIGSVIEGREEIVSLKQRAVGRYLAQDVYDAKGNVCFERNTYLEEEHVNQLDEMGIDEIVVRSVIACEAKHGICVKCYGRDLATRQSVNIGEAVGIIAAQSIGEPGTQLTMRTFHIGGAASQGSVVDSIESKNKGKVVFDKLKLVDSQDGNQVVVSRSGSLAILGVNGRRREWHKVPYGATIYTKNKTEVSIGDRLVSWDPHNIPLVAEVSGQILLTDVVSGITSIEKMDELTGINSIQILPISERPMAGRDLRPSIKIKLDKASEQRTGETQVVLFLDDNIILNKEDKSTVHLGDIIARTPQEGVKTRDITGGLPRVVELFEARSPKNPAVFAPISGVISFGRETKDKRRLIITDSEGNTYAEYIPKWRQINVHEGTKVEHGEIVVEGDLNPQDILKYLGINEMTEHIVDEVQHVYRLQGVQINDKHIEVIIRQMVRKIVVTDSGDSSSMKGEQLNYIEIMKTNKKLQEEDKRPIQFARRLLGITRASLATNSFISAASFQETTRVLTDAAIEGAVDPLVGLKENVLVGRLIPAGPGFAYHQRLKRKASQEKEEKTSVISYEKALMEEISLYSDD